MTLRHPKLVGAGLALAAALALAAVAHAQEGEAPEMAPPEPTAEHAVLTDLAGTWKVYGRMWMQEGAEPMEFKGQETVETVSGGMGVRISHTSSSAMGDFVGNGVEAWDPIRQKYVGYWLDSWGGVMIYEGTRDPSTKEITYAVKTSDIMQGAVVEQAMIADYPAENMRRLRFWAGTDTSGHPMMEIRYTKEN